MTETNITVRFGRPPGFVDFWRAFVANIFGLDSGYPKTAAIRAQRRWNGSLRIIPLSFLDGVDLPIDYPTVDPDEAAAQARANLSTPIPVSMGESGPEIARGNMPWLARARELGVDEVPIKVLWP